MAIPSTTSTAVERHEYLRLFAMAGTVRSWPSARRKLSNVKRAGNTVACQLLENATSTTPRCGNTATKVTPAKSTVHAQARSRVGVRGPPALVDLAIIA